MANAAGGTGTGGDGKPQGGLGSPFMLMMLMPMLLLLILTPDMRYAIGLGMDVCLGPVIGFGYVFPIASLLVASSIMVIATSILRHFNTNWIVQGRQSYLQKYVREKFKDAQGNPAKMKKVQELNAEIMKMTGDTMNTQMKTAMYTMVFSILLFMWLMYIMYYVSPVHIISTPWAVEDGWSLLGQGALIEFLTAGGSKGPMPNWVLMYSMFSLPITQVIQAGLKYYSFGKMIARIDRGEPAFKPFRLFPARPAPKTKPATTKKETGDIVVEDGDFEVDEDEEAAVEEDEKADDKATKDEKAGKKAADKRPEETIGDSEE